MFVLKREINGKELTMVFHRDYTSVFLFHKVFWVGRKTSAVPLNAKLPSSHLRLLCSCPFISHVLFYATIDVHQVYRADQGSPCKNSLSKAEHLCIECNHIFNAMKNPFHARDASNIICESVMYIPGTDIYAMYCCTWRH